MTEASRIRKKQMSGASVESILNPTKRDGIARKGGVARDHKRENYMRIKQVEKQNRLKQELASTPLPPPFKLKEFRDVPSKLATQRCNSLESMHSLSSALDCIEDRQTSGPKTALTRPSTTDSRNCASSCGTRSFIAVNAAAASKAPARTHPLPPSRDVKRGTPKGQLPKYLLDRKLDWAKKEEERLAALKAEQTPKGMMLIPDDERINTLNFLQQVREGLIRDLSRFPVIVETPSMKRKRAAIEAKLAEVDLAVDTFSKTTVYVEKEWSGVESSLNGVAKAARV
ncbi:hypothetical protein SeLEV6574_g02599 [Synchytrium endobioticum]|uniref:Enkurin domain-containing protein n=1 Tax=Synchytrium endobioticum TaxID=286115 RepID=A0A507D7Q0_9FUNG|nr:hypothetical protein SeLEV6574_g02599 [Synchytrium endobioticum]